MEIKAENFLILFNKLKREINSKPENLEWLPNQKKYLQELCYELSSCVSNILYDLKHDPQKYSKVPNTFPELWEEYIGKYAKNVKKAAEQEEKRSIDELSKTLEKAEQKAIEKGLSSEQFWDNIDKHYSIYSFSATEDDASYLIEDSLDYLEMIADNNISDGRITEKHIGAFRYIDEIVGLKFKKIVMRWNKAPHLFIPERATARNIQPIVELYHQALKCYVFGLNEASTSMCRALLEHVLKCHYSVNKWQLVAKIKEAKKAVC